MRTKEIEDIMSKAKATDEDIVNHLIRGGGMKVQSMTVVMLLSHGR